VGVPIYLRVSSRFVAPGGGYGIAYSRVECISLTKFTPEPGVTYRVSAVITENSCRAAVINEADGKSPENLALLPIEGKCAEFPGPTF
jgi:hypothetical protein